MDAMMQCCKAKSENLAHILGYQTGAVTPYAVDLAGLHAHGWDPLIPTVPGVYDGL